jgi:hypothetical protein
MNSPRTFFGTAGEPVPAVDAEDLQTAYEILTDPRHRPAGAGPVGFSVDIFSRVCKAGADISAVAYRAMMLHLLPMVAREQIAPLMKDDGKFDANVYREFAGLPMTWLPQGSMRGGTPFDVNEFLRRLASGQGQ